jgi:hypothetical protein
VFWPEPVSPSPGPLDTALEMLKRGIEDGAIVIGIKYIAKPGTQFLIRKAAYEKLIAAFRENNIVLVGRGVVVRVETGEPLPSEAVGAAAAHAIDQAGTHE